MKDSPGDGAVHIVEDNERIADMYQKWLSSTYDAVVSYTAEDALEEIADDVDLVLLDRDLPNKNGDEIVDDLRESIDDCVIAMLTATSPSTDLASLDVDDYIRKPVPEEKLLSEADDLLQRLDYDDDLREYLALARRAELLERKYSERMLDDDDQYAELMERLEDLHGEVDLIQLSLSERPELDL